MSLPLGRIEFGGPDLPPRRLRNLLQDHVDQAPAGSRIDWATYYFRDRALAEALMRASDRGVMVRLLLEARPRRADANAVVIAMLEKHGLNGGFHLRSPSRRSSATSRLHAKIYAFSSPEIAWIGSFNPSGDDPEDPLVIAEIGDQDRGHNLLLGIERPGLVRALIGQIDEMISAPLAPMWLRASAYLPTRSEDSRLYFYPRIITMVIEPSIAMLPLSGSVRAAISHLKKGPLSWALARAARRGASIELLVHDTERRVSARAFNQLEKAGARIRRVTHGAGLPMHSKFLLVEAEGRTTAWLGSYNFNRKSRTSNSEVLLATTDAQTIRSLAGRFAQISALA